MSERFFKKMLKDKDVDYSKCKAVTERDKWIDGLFNRICHETYLAMSNAEENKKEIEKIKKILRKIGDI